MDKQYTEAVCQDGAAILSDGEPITVDEILDRLNSIESLQARVAELEAALQKLINMHIAEMEGISSGMPTPEEWIGAVDDAHESLSRTPH